MSQEVHVVTMRGYYHHCFQTIIKITFVIEFLSGFALAVYSLLIFFHQPDPAKVASKLILVYSLLLILTSITGIVGISTDVCGRYGLTLSAHLSTTVAFVTFISAISLLISQQNFFNYVKKKKAQLFLDDKGLKSLENVFPYCLAFFLILAFLLLCRFFILKNLRTSLLEHDKSLQTAGQLENQRCINVGLEEPLLSEPLKIDTNRALSETYSSHPTEESVTTWWKEPDSINDDRSVPDSTFSFSLPWQSQKKKKIERNIDRVEENIEERSLQDEEFAPICEELEFEHSLLWSKEEGMNKTGGKHNFLNKQGLTECKGNKNSITCNDGPDLSWANED